MGQVLRYQIDLGEQVKIFLNSSLCLCLCLLQVIFTDIIKHDIIPGHHLMPSWSKALYNIEMI